MANIKLYVYIEAHGPKKQHGAFGWVLEYIRPNGDPLTKTGTGARNDTCDRYLALEAISEAMERLNTACEVEIIMDPVYMAETFPTAWEQGWIDQWRESDWKNAKGKDIYRADLWKRCDAALCNHSVTFKRLYGDNPYKNWIYSEINRVVCSNNNVSVGSIKTETAEKQNKVIVTGDVSCSNHGVCGNSEKTENQQISITGN